MQLNDQDTAGIPGLLPSFLRMRARVTEKVARGKDIHGKEVVILKHTPCEIHAWDLHAGDSVLTEGSERMLSYLPRVLYLKLPGAEWQVHAGLASASSPCVLFAATGH